MAVNYGTASGWQGVSSSRTRPTVSSFVDPLLLLSLDRLHCAKYSRISKLQNL